MKVRVSVPNGAKQEVKMWFNNDLVLSEKSTGGEYSVCGFEYGKAIKFLVDGNQVYNKTVKNSVHINHNDVIMATVEDCCDGASSCCDDQVVTTTPEPPVVEEVVEEVVDEVVEADEPAMGTTPAPSFGFWNKKDNNEG